MAMMSPHLIIDLYAHYCLSVQVIFCVAPLEYSSAAAAAPSCVHNFIYRLCKCASSKVGRVRDIGARMRRCCAQKIARRFSLSLLRQGVCVLSEYIPHNVARRRLVYAGITQMANNSSSQNCIALKASESEV